MNPGTERVKSTQERLTALERQWNKLVSSLTNLTNKLRSPNRNVPAGLASENSHSAPRVRLNFETRELVINRISVLLSANEFALYSFLLEHANYPQLGFAKQAAALAPLALFLRSFGKRLPESDAAAREQVQNWEWELHSVLEGKAHDGQSLRRQLWSLRKKFKKANLSSHEHFLLPQPGRFVIHVRQIK